MIIYILSSATSIVVFICQAAVIMRRSALSLTATMNWRSIACKAWMSGPWIVFLPGELNRTDSSLGAQAISGFEIGVTGSRSCSRLRTLRFLGTHRTCLTCARLPFASHLVGTKWWLPWWFLFGPWGKWSTHMSWYALMYYTYYTSNKAGETMSSTNHLFMVYNGLYHPFS